MTSHKLMYYSYLKDILQTEAFGHEGVGCVLGLGVKVAHDKNNVAAASLLHKLKHFKELTVSATGVALEGGGRETNFDGQTFSHFSRSN